MSVLYAACFAAQKHRFQRRKDADATPYINHPLEVAEILERCGVTSMIVLTSALLHDTIEDTETSAEELTTVFGGLITSIVLECSDNKTLPKAERKRLQIAHAAQHSGLAKLVKLADKLSNLQSLIKSPPQDWSQATINGYIYWGFAVCRELFGVNTLLDHELIEFFEQSKLFEDLSEAQLQGKLSEYYDSLTQ